MELSSLIIVVLVISIISIFVLFSYQNWQNSIGNTEEIEVNGNKYRVHKKFKDKKQAAILMDEIHERTLLFMNYMKKKFLEDGVETMEDQIVWRLVRNYDMDNVVENSPNNREGTTSFTRNKGELMALCLRNSKTGKLHDINTLMFVKIHELAHIACDEYGHPEKYWDIFRFMLQNAQNAGVIENIDYSKNPIYYCRMQIKHNPYFDPPKSNLN